MTIKIIVLACLLSVSQARFVNIKRPHISGRIIGGVDAQPGEFPHQVSIQYGRPPVRNYTHFCGGTIINERWILTAAHCIETILELQLRGKVIIKAGKHDLNVTESTEQESLVEDFVINENYTSISKTSPYDVGLLKLKTPFRFNDHVSAIGLPVKDSEPIGTVITSGWGALTEDVADPESTNILQKASLEIVDRGTCRKAMVAIIAEIFGVEIDEDIIDESDICTGPLTGGVSPCVGDSGGPLISKNKDGKTELVGVVSWGVAPCGRKGAPAVYVKVASIIDWIQDRISKI